MKNAYRLYFEQLLINQKSRSGGKQPFSDHMHPHKRKLECPSNFLRTQKSWFH